MSKAKVMIGVPMHSNQVSAQTLHSVTTGSSNIHVVHFKLLGLSLLAKNFNLLFCSAIYGGYDYFILHHSDLGVTGRITSQNGTWVDSLIELMTSNEMSAMSSVVPIKSQDGFTSSGLEMRNNDPFSLRRLTIKELSKLHTDVIVRSDVCELFGVKQPDAGALLINSGLLVMDIRNRGGVWKEKKWPGFNIHDTIEWNKSGRPESYTIPEDWGFSSWCHANGVKFCCTRSLTINHVGLSVFSSIGDWGNIEHDTNRQQVPIEDYRNTTHF